MTKPKATKQTTETSDKERLDAAKKIMEHVFGGGSVAQHLKVFQLIATDAEEEDLVNLTAELVSVKVGLGENATFDQVLGVHFALVEDEEGALLEDSEEIDDQIDEARAVLEESFGEEEANKAENLATFLGA